MNERPPAPGPHGRPRGRPHGWLVVDKPRGLTSAPSSPASGHSPAARRWGTPVPGPDGDRRPPGGDRRGHQDGLVHDGRAQALPLRRALGERRDSDDAEGRVVETSARRPDEAALTRVLPAFVGAIEQVPPAFSALKVGGERAYALARKGRPAAARGTHRPCRESDADGGGRRGPPPSRSRAARAPMSGRWPATSPARRERSAMCTGSTARRSGPSPTATRIHWINSTRSGIVWRSPNACFRSTRRWPTSRH